MTTQKRQIGSLISRSATRVANIQRSIANHLGLSYSITNKTVIVDSISNNIATIIINNDWNNKVQFNLSNLK